MNENREWWEELASKLFYFAILPHYFKYFNVIINILYRHQLEWNKN